MKRPSAGALSAQLCVTAYEEISGYEADSDLVSCMAFLLTPFSFLLLNSFMDNWKEVERSHANFGWNGKNF